MKRNRLYTVNKWNMPAFIPEKNLFAFGDFLNDKKDAYMGNWLGANNLSSTSRGLIGAAGTAVGTLGNNLISNGFNSGAGSGIANIGGTIGSAVSSVNPVLGGIISAGSGVIGGLTNRAFGTKTDQAALNAANEGISYFNNFTSNASTFDDIRGPQAMANFKNPYKGGWFKNVSGKNDALRKQFNEARLFADRSVENNVNNLVEDQLNDALANYSAYGGPLGFGEGALGLMQQNRYFNTIDKRSESIAKNNNFTTPTAYTGARTFDDGGLKMSFLDEFGTDPIGAAIRYSRDMEQRRAAQEVAEAQAAREVEYNNMQQRLANLETQNQGLQSMVYGLYNEPKIDALNTAAETVADAPVSAELGGDDDYTNLKRFIRDHEGFRSKAYWLPGEAAPTIGYGFYQYYPGTNRKVQMGDTITREEAEAGLTTVLQNIDKDLSKKVPNWDKLQNYQRDALRDLAYGTGTGGRHFRRNSRLMTALANEDYEAAEKELISRSVSLPSYNKNLLRISKLRQNMFRDGDYSVKAFGGELGTNGTDFTNGLLEVNAGGSHQDNPLEGVPMGVDAEGIPNLVEEGETVYNDYVFSDRMKVPGFMYKELGLGGVIKKKGKEMSFADASKKLAQESEQRPNDPISIDGLEASLSRLAEVQETERMKKQAEEYMGLHQYACGGKKGNMYAGPGKKSQQMVRGLVELPSLEELVNGTQVVKDVDGNVIYLPENWSSPNIRGEQISVLDLANPLFYADMWKEDKEIRDIMDREGISYNEAKYLKDTTIRPQMGIAPIGGRAGGYRVTPVNQRTATFNMGRQAAMPRQQAAMPAGRTTTAPATTATRNFTAEANTAADARALRTGQEWATNEAQALNARPTTTFTGRGTPDNTFGALRGAVNDATTKSLWGKLWPYAVGGTGLASALGLTMAEENQERENLERFYAENPSLAPTTSGAAANASQQPITTTPAANSNRNGYAFLGNFARMVADAARQNATPTRTTAPSPSTTTSPADNVNPLDSLIKFDAQGALNTAINDKPFETGVKKTEAPTTGSIETDEIVDARIPTYDTWMRYVPAVGSGIMALTDAFGLTNKPDYTYANKLEAAAERAGYAPDIKYEPIGDYMRYTPLDRQFHTNQLMASARATDRAIANTASPSKAAGLLANGYNTTLALGNLARQAEEYNRGIYERTKEFNRKTKMFNRQMGLEADMANARYRQQATQLSLSELAQAAALRDSIDQRVGASRSANITNFLNNIGNIGRENMAFNMVNATNVANNGYWIDRKGRIHYARRPKDQTT